MRYISVSSYLFRTRRARENSQKNMVQVHNIKHRLANTWKKRKKKVWAPIMKTISYMQVIWDFEYEAP